MTATLDVRAVSSMDAARADVEQLGDAVRNLGSDVDRAAGQARDGSLDFDRLGEGSDNVASKSSQAAGAMGDLAGGLDLIGASGAADSLGTIAIAAQVAAGAGDVLNLVAETSVGKWVASTAAMVGNKVATVASTVATGAMTAAQAALNAVMALNPIALVVIALAALAAGLILAYKHSETFRNIVDGAFSRARDVVEAASQAVQDIIGWFQGLPDVARRAWDAVRDAIEDRVDDAVGKVQDLVDDVSGFVSGIVDEVAGDFRAMFAPIETALGWVRDLIDKLSHIPTPDLGDLNPFGRVLPGGSDPTTPTDFNLGPFDKFGNLLPGAVGVPLNVTVQTSPLDRDKAARDVVDLLNEYAQRRGQRLSLTEVG